MEKHTPLFSILTPVYNVEKFLPACIDSVLAQTLTDWELILVDDGSTDTSGKICDDYAAKYPGKIRVFHKPNAGLLHTRRCALGKAQGAYYVILDSDDVLLAHALQTIFNKFNQYQCDCVIYGFERVSTEGKQIFVTQDDEVYFPNKRLLCKKMLFSSIYNALWRKAVKASLVNSAGYEKLYHIKLGEDLLQSLEIFHGCHSAVLIPDVLYRYTLNETSMTQQVTLRPVSVSFEVEEKVLEFLRKENIFTQQDWQEYYTYCLYSFQQQIKAVCSHPSSYKDKLKLFEQVQKHPYYRNFIYASTYKKPFAPFYLQFRLGWWKLLIIEAKVYLFLKRRLLKQNV